MRLGLVRLVRGQVKTARAVVRVAVVRAAVRGFPGMVAARAVSVVPIAQLAELLDSAEMRRLASSVSLIWRGCRI